MNESTIDIFGQPFHGLCDLDRATGFPWPKSIMLSPLGIVGISIKMRWSAIQSRVGVRQSAGSTSCASNFQDCIFKN